MLFTLRSVKTSHFFSILWRLVVGLIYTLRDTRILKDWKDNCSICRKQHFRKSCGRLPGASKSFSPSADEFILSYINKFSSNAIDPWNVQLAESQIGAASAAVISSSLHSSSSQSIISICIATCYHLRGINFCHLLPADTIFRRQYHSNIYGILWVWFLARLPCPTRTPTLRLPPRLLPSRKLHMGLSSWLYLRPISSRLRSRIRAAIRQLCMLTGKLPASTASTPRALQYHQFQYDSLAATTS